MKTSNKNNKKNLPEQTQEKEDKIINIRLLRLILLLFSILLYFYTITFDYTLDDTLMITGNKYTQKGLSGTHDIFTHDVFEGFFGEGKNLVAGGRYRPFTHFLFAVEKEFFGFKPWIGHLINILGYAILVLLVFEFLRKLIPERKKYWYEYIPFVAALLFAAHPIHTEVVSNIKGRDEIFSMGFALASILLLYKYLRHHSIPALLLSIPTFFIALLSKENAITWIGVWILILILFEQKNSWQKKGLSLISLLIPAILFIIIRSKVLGGLINTEIPKELLNNPFIHSSKSEEIATVLFTWLLYFKLLIFPHPLTHDYYPKQIEIISFSSIWPWLAIGITVFSLVFAIKRYKTHPILTFSILLFWGTFSIASNLFFNIGTFMNERFMFVPSLGFIILFCVVALRYLSGKKILMASLLVVLGLYSFKTIARSTAWKDNLTLFLTDVKTSSNSAKVNVSAAEILLQKAEAEPQKQLKYSQEAIKYLNKAEQIYPEYYGVYDLRGKAWFYQKNYTMSLNDYIKCAKMNTEKHTPINNIFIISQAAMRDSAHLDAYHSALFLVQRFPDTLRFNYQMAIVFDRIEKWDSSKLFLFRTLELDSNYAPAYNKLGELYGRIDGDFPKTSFYLLKAYKKNPKDYTTLENLGVMYAITKNFNEAMFYFRAAYSINPNNTSLNTNIGHMFNNLGKTDSANYYYTRAKQLKQKQL